MDFSSSTTRRPAAGCAEILKSVAGMQSTLPHVADGRPICESNLRELLSS